MDQCARTILVADDDPTVQRAVSRGLAAVEHRLLEADSVISAMEILRRQPIDLVVCSQRLEQVSGIELLSHVRQFFPRTARIRLVARGRPSIAFQAERATDTAHAIERAWDVEELRTLIRTVLRSRTARSTRPSAIAAADHLLHLGELP